MNKRRHLVWVPFGALVGFGASFIFGDLLTLPLDLYYLIYFIIVIALFASYIKMTRLMVREWFSRRAIWGVVLGLGFGVLMVQNVLSRPQTEQFSGAYLAWSIFWRGFVYGAIDGLHLTVFPWIVIWRAYNGEEKPFAKKAAFGVLAWLFVVVITTAYHAGYADFRSGKMAQPIIGNTIMSAPTLLAANPIGSPLTHAIMHMAAVIHCPKTGLFLPPHRE